MSMSSNMEDKEIAHLQLLIRETPVEVELTERVMKRYEAMRSEAHVRHGSRRSMMWIAASILGLAVALASTGFVSPAMAASLKKIPGMTSIFQLAGDLGLRTADQQGLVTKLQASDTHAGITLRVPEVIFDGTRVSLGLERQFADPKQSPQDSLGNALSDWNVFINGEPLQSYAPSGTSIGRIGLPGQNDNTYILQFSDLNNQGGRALPAQFQLTLDMAVEGIEDRFVVTIPVETNTRDNVVVAPAITRTYDNIKITLEKVEFTSITTDLTTRIELPEGKTIAGSSLVHSLGYDIVDDKGNKLGLLNGNGWNATDGNVLIMDTRFEPVGAIPGVHHD